jgi:hypothetical protein
MMTTPEPTTLPETLNVQQIELTSYVLGLAPYIVIEIGPSDDPGGYDINISAGGGMTETALVGLLAQTLCEHTGLNEDDTLSLINALRARDGKPLIPVVAQPVADVRD